MLWRKLSRLLAGWLAVWLAHPPALICVSAGLRACMQAALRLAWTDCWRACWRSLSAGAASTSSWDSVLRWGHAAQVSVVFATAVTKPGHGSLAPLAIGFTLFSSAFVGVPRLSLLVRTWCVCVCVCVCVCACAHGSSVSLLASQFPTMESSEAASCSGCSGCQEQTRVHCPGSYPVACCRRPLHRSSAESGARAGPRSGLRLLLEHGLHIHLRRGVCPERSARFCKLQVPRSGGSSRAASVDAVQPAGSAESVMPGNPANRCSCWKTRLTSCCRRVS